MVVEVKNHVRFSFLQGLIQVLLQNKEAARSLGELKIDPQHGLRHLLGQVSGDLGGTREGTRRRPGATECQRGLCSAERLGRWRSLRQRHSIRPTRAPRPHDRIVECPCCMWPTISYIGVLPGYSDSSESAISLMRSLSARSLSRKVIAIMASTMGALEK